jgi:hypothetical protein
MNLSGACLQLVVVDNIFCQRTDVSIDQILFKFIHPSYTLNYLVKFVHRKLMYLLICFFIKNFFIDDEQTSTRCANPFQNQHTITTYKFKRKIATKPNKTPQKNKPSKTPTVTKKTKPKCHPLLSGN